MRWKHLVAGIVASVLAALPAQAQQRPVITAGPFSAGHYAGNIQLSVLTGKLKLRLGSHTLGYSTKIELFDRTIDTYGQKHALTLSTEGEGTMPAINARTTTEGLTYLGVGVRNTTLPTRIGATGTIDATLGAEKAFVRTKLQYDAGPTTVVWLQKVHLPYDGEARTGTEAAIVLPVWENVTVGFGAGFDGTNIKEAGYGFGISVEFQ